MGLGFSKCDTLLGLCQLFALLVKSIAASSRQYLFAHSVNVLICIDSLSLLV